LDLEGAVVVSASSLVAQTLIDLVVPLFLAHLLLVGRLKLCLPGSDSHPSDEQVQVSELLRVAKPWVFVTTHAALADGKLH